MMRPLRPREPDDPRHTPVHLRRELLAGGENDRSLARLVKGGVLVRPRRGAYVDAHAYSRLDDAGRHGVLARAVLKNAGTDAVLSHTSAVPEYEGSMWHFDLTTVHVTREDGKAGRHEAGVQQHRGRLIEGDVVVRNGVRVMSATRAALEVTTVADVEASLCFVNHVLHHGLTTIEALRARYASMVTWPRTLTTDLVLRLANERVESLGESRTLYCLFRQSLPMPEVQYEVRDSDGQVVARLDFAWPELGVFLEFDGRVKYEKLLQPGERASDVVLREKRREELVCELTGWRCIRVTWADLEHPERLAARIRALFRPTAA